MFTHSNFSQISHRNDFALENRISVEMGPSTIRPEILFFNINKLRWEYRWEFRAKMSS